MQVTNEARGGQAKHICSQTTTATEFFELFKPVQQTHEAAKSDSHVSRLFRITKQASI